MFDLKDGEIKDEEAEMILQNRKWCYYVPRLLANFIRENKMRSAGAARWSKNLKCVHEKTRQNQGGGDTTQITDFAQTWHKCWDWLVNDYGKNLG